MTEQTPAAEVPSTGPKYLGDAVCSVEVPLAYPFELGGIEYRTVTVRRVTGREAQKWSLELRRFLAGEVEEPQFPGIDMPAAAFDALDDDDLTKLNEAADRFFPARFQPLLDLAGKLAGESNATTGEASAA